MMKLSAVISCGLLLLATPSAQAFDWKEFLARCGRGVSGLAIGKVTEKAPKPPTRAQLDKLTSRHNYVVRQLGTGLKRELKEPVDVRQAVEDVLTHHAADRELLSAAARVVGTSNGVFENPAALLERMAEIPALKDKPYGLSSFLLNPYVTDGMFQGGIEGFLNRIIDGAVDPIYANDLPPLSTIAQDLAFAAPSRPDLMAMAPRIYRRILTQPTFSEGHGFLWTSATLDDLSVQWKEQNKRNLPKAVALALLQPFLDYATTYDASHSEEKRGYFERAFKEILHPFAKANGIEGQVKWPPGR